MVTKLTIKQAKFVEEMLKDPSSQKAAAIRAGYAKSSASVSASDLMRMPKILDELRELRDIRKFRLGIHEDKILDELRKIAFANLGDYFKTDAQGNLTVNIDDLTKDQLAALGELSYYRGVPKVKLHDKLAALTTLGKSIGMFQDKQEHTVKLSLEELVLNSMKPLVKKEDTA